MRHHLLHLTLSLFICMTGCRIFSQQPFICRGNTYLAFTDGLEFTKVFEIVIDPITEQVEFLPLSEQSTGVDLNAMGYRYKDNFIYGINAETLEVYRVGRDGVAYAIGTLAQQRYLLFVAGDVSPDGKHLVMVGTGFFKDEVLAFIDLDSPDLNYSEVRISGPEVRSADIAFDPVDGKLYGFDGILHRLVTYDVNSGSVNADFPPTEEALLMGGLFFDTYGNLFGYGLAPGENAQKALYSIDKQTGIVSLETNGPPVSRNDGCSCLYNVGLLETIDAKGAIPCTEIPIRLELVNQSRETQTGLRLEQQFPGSFEIVDIYNPLEAELLDGGPGSNFFTFDQLTLPQGRHEIVVTVALGAEAAGTYNLQARLTGLPAKLGEITLSDNPATLVRYDSTSLEIGSLEVDFSQVRSNICSGDSIVLDAGVQGATYMWSDGSNEPTFTVTRSGTYSVTVSTGCETVEETIEVGGIGFELDLGPDLQVGSGESVRLQPRVTPSDEGLLLQWQSSGDPVDCMDCAEALAMPNTNTSYYLTATDTSGCTVTDSIFVEVIKDRQVYLPNAFSPNGDGQNDYFFLQTKLPREVVEFKIFDRWGNLLFERANHLTNDYSQGWDGRFRGKKLDAGTYYYMASIILPDGEVVPYRGQVSLIQ